MTLPDIRDLSYEELLAQLKICSAPNYCAQQLFNWLYKRRAGTFDEMSDLALALRERLKGKFQLNFPRLKGESISADLTCKVLLSLSDGNMIEAVLIPAKGRNTVCVSTQVGCKFRCEFCASGQRFVRNLRPGEMVNQVLFFLPRHKATNVVFMGMGEALDNYDNLMKAIRILNHPYGLNFGARRITISTCGLPDKISKLAGEGLQVELSISLHAARDALRSRLMPVNRRYNLKSLLSAARNYIHKTNRQITFEYVLIKGLNDSSQDVRALARLLQGLLCKVNLIPLNPIDEGGAPIRRMGRLQAPNEEALYAFYQALRASGIHTTIRRSRGRDIDAACGQLRLRAGLAL